MQNTLFVSLKYNTNTFLDYIYWWLFCPEKWKFVQVRLLNIIKHAHLYAIYLSAFQRSRAGSCNFLWFFSEVFRAGLRRKKCKHPIKYRYVTRTNFWAKKNSGATVIQVLRYIWHVHTNVAKNGRQYPMACLPKELLLWVYWVSGYHLPTIHSL